MSGSFPPSLLFHDYETWGISASIDYPCQFAAIRTDLACQPIDQPIDIMAQIHLDYLPHPQACLVTGITPQYSQDNGLNEHQFMTQIHAQMSVPNTCSVGYNSIKFDDEFTRYSLFRNFFDPYKREWEKGNSRWDIINLVRACYALRPEGINWPMDEEDKPSFKLERLTQANGVSHEQAHDALNDVHATIAMTQLIQQHQPRLFDYAFTLRSKHKVADCVSEHWQRPLLYINAYRSARNGCVSFVVPIAAHPTNNNATICIDLTKDITPLLTLDISELTQLMYLKQAERTSATPHVAILDIKHNQCPFIAPTKTLSPQRAIDLGLDVDLYQQRFEQLQHVLQSTQAQQLINTCQQLCQRDYPVVDTDIEASLYRGAFFTAPEKQFCDDIHNTPPNNLSNMLKEAPSARMQALGFRFLARNYPECLSEEQHNEWLEHCQQHLFAREDRLSFQQYFAVIDELLANATLDPRSKQVLHDLHEYGQSHPMYVAHT